MLRFLLVRRLNDFYQSPSLAVGVVTDPIAFGPRLYIGSPDGILPFLSDRFSCEVISWRKDSNGRISSILLCGNTEINVVNIYAPKN